MQGQRVCFPDDLIPHSEIVSLSAHTLHDPLGKPFILLIVGSAFAFFKSSEIKSSIC